MDLYELFQTIHVLAAVTWVGGAILVQILVTRMQRAQQHRRLGEMALDVAVVGQTVFLPASMIVLLAGIARVVESGWSFTDLWIALGIIGIVFTALTGSIFLGPEAGRVGQLINDRGPEDAEVQSRLARIFLVSRIDLVVLVLIVINMVVKPGA